MASVTESTITKEITDCEFNDILDEAGEVTIAGTNFWPSDILKEMRPNDYEHLKSDYDFEAIEYTCDECGCEFDNEFDAECCCPDFETFECEICGGSYDDEESAETCCDDED
jgi:hypothetical protein